MLEARELTKKYGSRTVVDHLSFTIRERQICGFLGVNGAGKSTTMNMLTGCLAPTSVFWTEEAPSGRRSDICRRSRLSIRK